MSDAYALITTTLVDNMQVEPEEIKPEATFEDLEIDSLFLLELAVTIENRLGVQLQDGELLPEHSLADAVVLINGKRSAA